MKFEFSRHILEKVLNIKFRQNPSSGSRVVPCGQTDMTKVIVAFRNFTNAPKKGEFIVPCGSLLESQELYLLELIPIK